FETSEHGLRRTDPLRDRLRRRWGVWKNWGRGCRSRHGRRHGAALRWIRAGFARILRVNDDQWTGADHHGDVYCRGETPLWSECCPETARDDPSRYFQRGSSPERNYFPNRGFASLSLRYDRMDHARNAALVSGLDQRLSYRRSWRDAGAAGSLHALEWFRVCGDARCARHSSRPI